jgi:diguanylate cyclase (GGDEF)-like protein/PAS domain S-box-containing protein
MPSDSSTPISETTGRATLQRARTGIGGALAPERKAVFLREAPAFSVWLLIFLFGGVGLAHGRANGWIWIGVSAAIALLRVLIAMRALAPQRSHRAISTLAIGYLATHIAQAALWLVPVLAPGSPALSDWRTSASLATALLVSAACLRGWRAGWLVALVGWGAAGLTTAIGLWASLPVASIGFGMLLAAIAWAGLAPGGPTAAPARVTRLALPAPTGGSTRRGMQLAIHASATPMIGVYDGRIFDLNKSAEAFLGRPAAQCLGRPAAELLKVDPPSALDAAYPGAERRALVTPEMPDFAGVATVPVMAHIRVGRSGNQRVAIAVISLAAGPDYSSDRELGTDARRLADWVGADASEVWYRDETGHLHLPRRFDPGRPLEPGPDSDAFPLAPLVPEDERPYVNTLYREQLAAGHTFDDLLTLRDSAGVPRSVRVVCLSRPGLGGQRGAVIGVVADGAARATGQVARSDLLSELPVLIWLIDASGRLIHAHTGDVRRWGLRIEPRLRPAWTSSLALEAASQPPFAHAVQQALEGKPTFDLLNYRSSRSGGRLALRSHFAPFHTHIGEGKIRRAVMVMDTIASVRELLDIERLRLSKAQYKDLVEASPNLIWACDSAFRFTFISRRACRDVYGYEVEELLGRSMSLLLDAAADQTGARQALVGLRENRALRDVDMSHRTRDGQRITVAMSAVALRQSDGSFAGAIGINVDVTALKQREALLADALRVERTLLDSAGQAIAVVKAGAVARCNDAFLQLLQMRPDQLATKPVADIFAERTHWSEVADASDRASASDGAVAREIRVRRAGPTGTPEQFVWCQLTLRAIGDGEYVVALADIDQIRRREAHAQHDARHDDLTGLPNRRLLSERVRAALATSGLRNSGCAILVFDLDGFKPINDKFGHPVGDVVLREIARRLLNIVRPQDTVARIGGDEFALLMPDCGATQDVERIAQRILREVAQPLTEADLGGAQLTASLGVVLAPEHGHDPERLMRLADRAMYDAKVGGGDRVVFCGSAARVIAEQTARRAS